MTSGACPGSAFDLTSLAIRPHCFLCFFHPQDISFCWYAFLLAASLSEPPTKSGVSTSMLLRRKFCPLYPTRRRMNLRRLLKVCVGTTINTRLTRPAASTARWAIKDVLPVPAAPSITCTPGSENRSFPRSSKPSPAHCNSIGSVTSTMPTPNSDATNGDSTLIASRGTRIPVGTN